MERVELRQDETCARPNLCMDPRNKALLIGTLVIGAAVGIAFCSQGALAIELPVVEQTNEPLAEATIATDGQLQPTQAQGSLDKDSHDSMTSGIADRSAEDSTGLTAGIIRGDIQLAVSVLDKLGSITVIVEEVRRAFDNTGSGYKPPTRLYAAVERGLGTPTFEVRDIPFSDYPYRVIVRAAKLNGGQRTVSVTKETPIHDVVLAITPGAPYSILLRDQDSGTHPDIDVVMKPIGLPNGRPRLADTTDNFGSVIFGSVLAGNYELRATSNGQPFGEVQQVTVQPGARNFGRKIQGQGHVMTIARGVQLDVRVHDRFGYPMDGCTVTATATSRRKLTELEGTTDMGGRLRFAHLQPGTWQLTVQRDEFQRIDQQITLRADQAPQLREIRLVRARTR